MKIAVAAFVLAAHLASTPSNEITFTAASVNVAGPGTPVKIKILRWTTEDELRPIVTALAAPPAQPSDVARADAAAGRGRAGVGRGRGRGGAAAAPLKPIDAFAAALRRAPTVGYIWTNDITGYSIKYAWHSMLPGGSTRVVLASDRRLGAYGAAWKPSPAAAETDYAFTLIELHVGPNGTLEGKTSLTAKIAVDPDAKTVALEDYASAPTSLARSSSPR